MGDLTTTEPSMYDRREKEDWPANALPKHWIAALFSKMTAFYGAKFADQWRGGKTEEIQKVWGIELFKLTREQLKAGSESLTALPKPPTLPEFIGLCKQARLEQVQHAAHQLENFTPADKATIDVNLSKLRRIVGGMKLASAHPGWAYDFCIRGTAKNGQPVTVEVWGHCRDAILSPVGRSYPKTQEGDRAEQCYSVLSQVVKDAAEGRSKFNPYAGDQS
jgi:hypothetical protein